MHAIFRSNGNNGMTWKGSGIIGLRVGFVLSGKLPKFETSVTPAKPLRSTVFKYCQSSEQGSLVGRTDRTSDALYGSKFITACMPLIPYANDTNVL